MNSKIVGGLPAMRLRYSSLFICIVGIVPLLICTSLVQTVHAEANANTNAKASSVHEADRYRTRDFTTLSGDGIRRIAEAYPPEYESVTDGHLGKLLIPRASGSENNTLVQNYISSMFTNLGWYEEKTPFTGSTPIGEVEFTNLIYTFDPDAPRKIILSAHFDSKWFPDYPANQFIGATDSAAPCALLLSLAEFITPLLSSRRDRLQALQGILRDGYDEEELSETTLQLVFFDGEEAFHDWTATDSIYGARHLAETWSETYLPSSHPLARRRQSPLPSVLNTIDVLVLLDLLGNSHSSLHSYFRETDWLFDEMKSADQRLRDMGLVEVERGQEGWFSPVKMRRGMIGDDHIPFLHRGVSILHVISSPFPNVWHTLGDDASVLSLPALRRWNRILRVFTCEYLGLSIEDESNPASEVTRSSASASEAESELDTDPSFKSGDEGDNSIDGEDDFGDIVRRGRIGDDLVSETSSFFD